MDEKPISNPLEVVEKVTEQIYPYVKDCPYCFFGYSMGGDTSMMVAHRLATKYNCPPIAMVFAATPALHTVLFYLYLLYIIFILLVFSPQSTSDNI